MSRRKKPSRNLSQRTNNNTTTNQGKPHESVVYGQVRAVREVREGPLPDPDAIARYDALIPNGAERIMAQWEKETEHRHLMQRRAQLLPFWDQIIGRISALLFAGGCLAVSAWAIHNDQPYVAAVFIGMMVVAGIRAFMKLKG